MSSPLLALDLGLARTGVALSESGIIAQPLVVIENRLPHLTNTVQEILSYVQEYAIQTLVIGVPYTQDEALTGQALKVEAIITQLEEALIKKGLTPEIVRVNEFYSSQDADRLFPTTPRDSAAAAIILQSYIDQNS